MREAVRDWTGQYQDTCPWRAFTDPFVGRVLEAHRWYESGQLAFAYPNASHRLIEGVGFFHSVSDLVASKQMAMEREKREAERKAGRRG